MKNPLPRSSLDPPTHPLRDAEPSSPTRNSSPAILTSIVLRANGRTDELRAQVSKLERVSSWIVDRDLSNPRFSRPGRTFPSRLHHYPQIRASVRPVTAHRATRLAEAKLGLRGGFGPPRRWEAMSC